MSAAEIIPWVTILAFVIFASLAAKRKPQISRFSWMLPAGLSAAFFGFTLWPVMVDGPLGFWASHVLNPWGNQIFLDLVLAIGVAWAFMMPRLKAVGMQPWPWLALILCTGSIGLLAMAARFMFLTERNDCQPGENQLTSPSGA